MVDEGPADAVQELSSDERLLLAAWAEHEPSEGFADAVVMAWAQECNPSASPTETPTDTSTDMPTEPVTSRRSPRGMIGVVSGLAAAAAVLLFMRLIGPGPSSAMAQAPGCEPEILIADVSATPASTEPERSLIETPDRMTVLGDDAVAVLTRHCSPCHDGLDGDAKAGALEIFDVRQPRWWSGMSNEQLQEMRLRIEQFGAADDDERQRVDAFVAAQLTERAHAG